MTPPAGAVDWKRNLAALWFAEFTAIFGFAFAFPFMPIFVKELGVTNPGDLARITGLAAGASGFSLAIMSPIWGVLADRYGRKSMLLRAILGGAVTVGLMSFSQAAWHIIVLRLLQGATSGTVAAATTLVASETPRSKVGWALGVLSSSIAVGGALGPVVGGLLAHLVGIRQVFLVGGILLVAAIVPVMVMVRETPRTARTVEQAPAALATLRAAGAGTVAAVVIVLVAQALAQISYSAFQPLIVLRLLEIAPTMASYLTGLTFGIAGLASAAAAVVYSGAARRFGYLRTSIAAAAAMAITTGLAGALSPIATVVITGGVAGFFYGVVGPALNSMLGLETPSIVQARVFGFSASAVAIGFGLGPLAGGEVAARQGIPVAIVLAACFGALTAVLLAVRGREPAR